MSEAADPRRPAGLGDEDRSAVETFPRASAGRPDLLNRRVSPGRRDIPLAPGARPGREAMRPLIAGFLAAFLNVEATVHEIIGEAGRAAGRAGVTALHGGEWFGVAPAGGRFSVPLHEFHHIGGGRLTRTWHLEDWLGRLRQVGASPRQDGRKEIV